MSYTTRTLRSKLSPADLCRANGWTAGTHLIGNEGYGPTVIQITAVGYDSVLARCVEHKGVRQSEREQSWTLEYRDWIPDAWKHERCVCTADTVKPRCRYHAWIRVQDTAFAKLQQQNKDAVWTPPTLNRPTLSR